MGNGLKVELRVRKSATPKMVQCVPEPHGTHALDTQGLKRAWERQSTYL